VKLHLTALAALAIAAAPPASAQTPAEAETARAAFARAVVVFQHPRCTNCHNRGEGPRQGNTPRVHFANVKRGPDGRGEGAQRCVACHKDTNTGGGTTPGAPDWRMPPPGRAGWDGLTPAEICAALKDPARNAGLRPDQVVEHMAQDKLVLWAWAAGGIRSAPPLAHAEFMALMRSWNAGGAPCPS
jgi:mono/diheme cytochrome c family protein